MKANPLLEEIWATKDRLAAEAGGDIHVLCQQLRKWAAENIPANRVIHDPAQLRTILADEQRLVLREEPPKPGKM